MSKKHFSEEQIEQLVKDDNVIKCSSKSITYSEEFKVKAIKQYEQGIPAKEIFLQAGLAIELIGREQPNECLKRWRKIVKKKGMDGLSESRGRNGGKLNTKGLTDKEKIERLELTVAYQKEKILFLSELRAKRKE